VGRKSTGTVRILKNDEGEPQWHAKWTRADGSRSPWLPLDPHIALDDQAGAKAAAARMAPKVRTTSLGQLASATETVRDYFARLHAAKEAKGLVTVKDMKGRAKRWVFPLLGDRSINDVTRADGEKLVAQLDAAIAAFRQGGPGPGRLSPATAANVWAMCSTRLTKR